MNITGQKSFVNFLKIIKTQIYDEMNNCYIPEQYYQVYYKCLGIEQTLNSMKTEIKDEKIIEYIGDCLESIETCKYYCQRRF
ncbi:hypothetical protein [Robertmurraya siralis]|uniref:hypothetical protein n=1 Tax=Robertmurraya siralis TaxID=77777 RepID=UPI0010F7D310|nr:hypothetical protein [Robertmurraya siralis]